MNWILALLLLLCIVAFAYFAFTRDSGNEGESFQLDHYVRPNYESGANMLRGDLPIQPVNQSWFNTRYGPSSLAPGFFAMSVY